MQLRDFLDLSVFDVYLLTMISSPGHDRIPVAFFSDSDKSQKVDRSSQLVMKLRILNNPQQEIYSCHTSFFTNVLWVTSPEINNELELIAVVLNSFMPIFHWLTVACNFPLKYLLMHYETGNTISKQRTEFNEYTCSVAIHCVCRQPCLQFPYIMQNGNKSRIWVKSLQSLRQSFKISFFHLMTWVC